MSTTKTTEDTDGDCAKKTSRTVVTKTVEQTSGCRTTKTTLRSVPEDGLDSALSKLDFDPKKFGCGGTSVKKTVVYTDSSGKREVIEEVIENYGDPDELAGYRQKVVKEGSTSSVKSDAAKMGNQRSQKAKVDPESPKVDRRPSKVDPGSPPKVDRSPSKVDRSPSKVDRSPSKVDRSPSKVDPGPVSSTGQFEQDCLRAHNVYRKKHGVPDLTLSKEMCAYSKEWADHLAKTDTFEHRTKEKKYKRYGENIFLKWSSDSNFQIKGNLPVDSWYSEIKYHVFDKEQKGLKSGHFSQVIWKDSRYLGVAWARGKSGKIVVVANYDPPGNFIGKFVQNVPPPRN